MGREAKGAVGVGILKDIMEDCPPWRAIQVTYRNPNSAKWAVPAGYTLTKSGRKRLVKRWNDTFDKEILTMLAGEGSPVQSVIKRAWDLDTKTANKAMATFLIRRLVSKRAGVDETGFGLLV